MRSGPTAPGRVAVGIAGGVLGGGVVIALVVLLVGRGGSPLGPVADPVLESPAPSWAPPAEPPVAAADPGVGVSGLVDAAWGARVAEVTGIPERAVLAYAGAALAKSRAMPECGLSWATLAAIGGAESAPRS